MDLSYVVSFPQGVSVSSNGDGHWVLHGQGRHLVQRQLPPPIQEVLPRLVYPGDSLEKLAQCVRRAGHAGAVTHFVHQLGHLAARGFLLIATETDGTRLASLMPISPSFVLKHDEVGDEPYVLSRFAHVRRGHDTMVLESPLSPARIVLHDPRAMLAIGALGTSATAAQLADRVHDLPPEVARQFLNLLRLGGMLAGITPSGTSSEDTQDGLQGWEFHDLLFHVRSREGRHDGAVGNTYALAGHCESPPVVRPPFPGTAIELHRPDMDALQSHDPPLAHVMEQRRSIRDYGPQPMTARQLGEFLFRVARVREIIPTQVDTPQGQFQVDLSSRPYPTGGSLFELEIYPVVRACRDLEPGLYHYDPLHHRLGHVSGTNAAVEQLWDEAGFALGTHGEHVQVLLVLTARFERVMWKYSGLAYSLILKDVGVMFQSMYLAATAMNLAPCALGAGNSDLFSKAMGGDYYCETSVGEFTLGSTVDTGDGRVPGS